MIVTTKSAQAGAMGYHQVSLSRESQSDAIYSLQRYVWRSILGIVGPLLLLGFYSFICFHYLTSLPENNIILDIYPDAMVPFYAWLVISVFALDWARTALSNFQATVLMHPNLAPVNALSLFWHVDDNWANPLWWLRALRNMSLVCTMRVWQYHAYVDRLQHYKALPGVFWVILSGISMLIFVAIPLSGLTMEVTSVYTPGGQYANILGPKNTTFNMKGMTGLAGIIYGNWKGGGTATPADSSYFYAPTGSSNVTLTYFEDQSRLQLQNGFTTFLGPAVNDLVIGRSSGLQSSVRCSQVKSQDLRLLTVHDWAEYEVSEAGKPEGVPDLLWFNETGCWSRKNAYSLIVATEGTWYGSTPYVDVSNRDSAVQFENTTISSFEDLQEALLEVYLWQGIRPDYRDTVIESMWQNQSEEYRTTTQTMLWEPETNDTTKLVGFGIQCQIRSAYGIAQLFPHTRTYKDFVFSNVSQTGGDSDVYPPQILAIEALGDWDMQRYKFQPRDPTDIESTWLAMHLAINEPAHEIQDNPSCGIYNGFQPTCARYAYTSLTPQNVMFALHRLIGKSLITVMSAGSQDPWQGDLYRLDVARWLKPGFVSWKPVLTILALWSLSIAFVSTWTLFTKRWAPVLSGFELFRFGAQYSEEVDRFDTHRFEVCNELDRIPGAVGVLAGGSTSRDYGFVGLSECMADQNGTYVYDRSKASKDR